MASWETEKTSSTFDATNSINTMSNNRDAARSGASSTTSSSGGGIFGFGGYSVVGINVQEVDSMCAAIRSYVEKVQSHLNGIDPLADASNAFKSEDGQVEQAVQSFAENVKEYCVNLCSGLLAFSDKLKDVKNAWIQSTSNMAETIKSDTAASDTGSAYQESIK